MTICIVAKRQIENEALKEMITEICQEKEGLFSLTFPKDVFCPVPTIWDDAVHTHDGAAFVFTLESPT